MVVTENVETVHYHVFKIQKYKVMVCRQALKWQEIPDGSSVCSGGLQLFFKREEITPQLKSIIYPHMWYEKTETDKMTITLLLKDDTVSLLRTDLKWESETEKEVVSAVKAGGSALFGTLIALKLFEIDFTSLAAHMQASLEKFANEADIHVVVYMREHTTDGSLLYANRVRAPKVTKLVLNLGVIRSAKTNVCEAVYAILVNGKYIEESYVKKIFYYNMKISTDVKQKKIHASVTLQDNQLHLLRTGLVWKRESKARFYGLIVPMQAMTTVLYVGAAVYFLYTNRKSKPGI
jgi:hypothetical protein